MEGNAGFPEVGIQRERTRWERQRPHNGALRNATPQWGARRLGASEANTKGSVSPRELKPLKCTTAKGPQIRRPDPNDLLSFASAEMTTQLNSTQRLLESWQEKSQVEKGASPKLGPFACTTCFERDV